MSNKSVSTAAPTTVKGGDKSAVTVDASIVASVSAAVAEFTRTGVNLERGLVIEIAAKMTRPRKPLSVETVKASLKQGMAAGSLLDLKPTHADYMVEMAALMNRPESEGVRVSALAGLVANLRAVAAKDKSLSKSERLASVSAAIATAPSVPALIAKTPSRNAGRTTGKGAGNKSGASQQGKRTDLAESRVNFPNLAAEISELVGRLEALRGEASIGTATEGFRLAFARLESEIAEWAI